ncbi:hypothetical protein K431DRAFT_246883 [Polychaeton citri CBS 116435]|uniref:DNA polymerase delta subunit 3 n=1 Tax=Polychaeton citri CBS 116435 TaxID=1314669 RepID=A0A9P4Q888_9PEZI|nr:hypothetical protein K431DRAFT_246883 [Polychaeton citri CBS 116435]
MAQDYNEHLAVHVLNEQQYVSYRSLSRALKVHSNLAKQMLFEFHRKQNAKKPGSVHATYLISGTTFPTAQKNNLQSQSQTNTTDLDGDVGMQSSPPMPASSMPESDAADEDRVEEQSVPVKTVMLVKEEQLEQARALFETVISIHVYSLEANGLSDVQALTECNRNILASYKQEDPLKDWKQYGTIQNPKTRRRTMKGKPPSAAVTIAMKAEDKVKPMGKTNEVKKETQVTSKKPPPETDTAAKGSAATKPATMKREGSSIFKAFGKAKEKPKAQATDSPAEVTPKAEQEDESMGGLSEDNASDHEQEGDVDEASVLEGKSKKERQAELEAMMDQEDEEMEEPALEEEEEEETAIDSAQKKAEVAPETEDENKEHVEVSDGRRRGRRRIIKKKTVKDAEGYLVTREEPAWESFSEDEPAPKKAKTTSTASATTLNKGGSKKGAKAGQGSIMSFFGKK